MTDQQLAIAAHNNNQTFALDYYTDLGRKFAQVFLVRRSNEDFTIHHADTGRFISHGDTKADATTAARIALHQSEDFGLGY